MSSVFSAYPVLRSMLAYSVLYPAANFVEQTVIRKKKFVAVNWREVGRFCVYGALCHAPLVYNWIKLAVYMFPANNFRGLAAKVLADQLFFAPIGLSAFYIGLTVLEGKTKAEVYEEWANKFPKTWAMGACIWPFLQTINFRYVPAHQRAVFVGCMSFFWTTALAFWKSESGPLKIREH